VFCLLLFCTSFGCKRVEQGLNPGDAAPAVQLKTLDGKDFDIKDFSGKVVLLNFWATWCAPCVVELPVLQQLYDRDKDRGLVVVAVGIDDTNERLAEVAQEAGVKFPVLFDEQGEVRRRYKVTGVPESFLADRSGKMVLWMDQSQRGMPTVRILGAPDWMGQDSIQQIEKLLTMPVN
jgi:peroxiredoxin